MAGFERLFFCFLERQIIISKCTGLEGRLLRTWDGLDDLSNVQSICEIEQKIAGEVELTGWR